MCYFQYVDDLIILIVKGIEDLKIVKLIFHLYKDLNDLAIKNCHFPKTLDND